MGDDAADASADHAVAGEGIGEHATAEVIEEQSHVAAYPQPLVALVDSQGTGEVEHPLHGWLDRQWPDHRRLLHVERADAAAPCADPQRVVGVVGGERRDAVVGQCGVGGGIVYKGVGAGCLAVETALDGTHPQRAVVLGKHRVDTVGRDRAGVARSVDIVDQVEQAWRQLVDAARLGADPYLSLRDEEAVDEVARERQVGGGHIIRSDPVGARVVDIHAAQRADEQLMVLAECEACHKVVCQAHGRGALREMCLGFVVDIDAGEGT